MSRVSAKFALAGLAAFGAARADTTALGLVYVDEPVPLEIRVANPTHADVIAAKAVPTCDCLQPIFSPTTIGAGSTAQLPFTYLAHYPGAINVAVDFQDQAGRPIRRAMVRGFVAQRSWLVSPEQLHAWPASDVVVVDVRSASRFADAHLARAINLLPFALKARSDLRVKRLVLLDDGFAPDALLSQVPALRASGFRDVTVLQGGLPAWVRAGYPVEGRNPVEVFSAMITPADFARASATASWRTVEVSSSSHAPSLGGAVTVSEWRDVVRLAAASTSVARDRAQPLLVVASDPAAYGKIENALHGKSATPVYYLIGGRPALEAEWAAQAALAAADHRTYQSAPPSKSHPAVTGGGCSSCGR